jgi:hypothetical protein
MKPSGEVLHIEKVIMYASLFDEHTLHIGDKIIHEQAKAKSKHFGYNPPNGMNKANGAEVGDLLRPILLGEKSNIHEIKPMKILRMKVTEEVNHPHKVPFYYAPTLLEENPGKAIRAGSLVARHLENSAPHLLLRERIPKPTPDRRR